MRYVITLQYDGGGYHGWQKQKTQPVTLQQTVEEAVERVTCHAVTVEGSGRTDEGVHALGQTAHFDTDKTLPAERYRAAINYYLPPDVRVTACREAKDTFHARKSVKRKTYVYKLYNADVENPLLRTRAYCVSGVSAERMNEAAKYLVGKHDFSAFMSSGSSAKTFTRTVFAASVAESGGDITFSITGDGFLYNMVRIIVGALVKIGRGDPTENMEKILKSRDRRLAPDIAPPHGLYLFSVEYD